MTRLTTASYVKIGLSRPFGHRAVRRHRELLRALHAEL